MPAKAKVTIALVFDDESLNRQDTVEVGPRLQGQRLLDGIDKAVEKKFPDEPWTRWNLINVEHQRGAPVR